MYVGRVWGTCCSRAMGAQEGQTHVFQLVSGLGRSWQKLNTSLRNSMGTPVLRMRESWEGELKPAQKLDSQSRASALYSLAVSKLWLRMLCARTAQAQIRIQASHSHS